MHPLGLLLFSFFLNYLITEAAYLVSKYMA